MISTDLPAQDDDPWTEPAKNWSRHEPPFRPHRDDSAVIERVAAALADEQGALTAVMLGVTPETAACAWPPKVRLRAFDGSPAMIAELWPAPGTPAGARAEVADWSNLPLATGEVDLVAGDHSLGCLDWPDDVAHVLEELRRVLRPGGRLVLRAFTRPEVREDLDGILADLKAGRFGSASAVNARFGAWLHSRGTAGIAMQELKDMFRHYLPDPEATSRRFRWRIETCDMPNNYDNGRRIVMPTLAELRAALAPHFNEIECATGSYELAERFPTLILTPR